MANVGESKTYDHKIISRGRFHLIQKSNMIIRINNIILLGIYGLTEKEKINPQRFKIDVSAELPNLFGENDDIKNTFDYRKIKNIIHEVIKGERCNLLETLAGKIADRVIENQEISSVEVCVAKMDIWKNGFPSVMITRRN